MKFARIEGTGIKIVRKGGISAETEAWLGARSSAFAEATSRPPGKAMEYGKIKKEAGRAAR